MRESKALERQFEPRSQNEFFSPAIGTTILFEKGANGAILLTIKKAGSETHAKKARSRS
jgi:hypothetical protein